MFGISHGGRRGPRASGTGRHARTKFQRTMREWDEGIMALRGRYWLPPSLVDHILFQDTPPESWSMTGAQQQRTMSKLDSGVLMIADMMCIAKGLDPSLAQKGTERFRKWLAFRGTGGRANTTELGPGHSPSGEAQGGKEEENAGKSWQGGSAISGATGSDGERGEREGPVGARPDVLGESEH
mmetsp:Transcript_24630/g.49924  ORF Transcript_24630/g.49924 Transcript_24630/m.49924 type:complete len:183 (-) Transcript_24630:410-958(-)